MAVEINAVTEIKAVTGDAQLALPPPVLDTNLWQQAGAATATVSTPGTAQ